MTGEPEEDPYVREVRRKADRMARARRERQSVWVALGQAGTLGWQFVLPLIGCTLAGRALGVALDRDGPTLAGIAVGVFLGGWQVARSLRAGLQDGGP